MYTIKAYVDSKEYTIHDARVKALTVGGNPYFEIGITSTVQQPSRCFRHTRTMTRLRS